MDLRVDGALCTNCGECVETCPLGAVALLDDGLPYFRLAECMECGHCVAVCREGAISADGLRPEAAVQPSVQLDDLRALFGSRRSVRAYEDRPVPQDLLERVLSAATYAPSAANCQCCHFTVLRDPERRRDAVQRVMSYATRMRALMAMGALGRGLLRLAGSPVKEASHPMVVRAAVAALDKWQQGGPSLFHNAPVIVIVHSSPEAVLPREDACYAAYQAVLAAHAAGLGACIIGFGPPLLSKLPDLRRDLGIPPDHQVQVVFILGYPAERFPQLPPRRPLRLNWV